MLTSLNTYSNFGLFILRVGLGAGSSVRTKRLDFPDGGSHAFITYLLAGKLTFASGNPNLPPT